MKNKKLSLAYVSGFIETDGGFKCSIEKTGNLKPMITLSQKTNSNLLPEIKEYLSLYGVQGSIQAGEVNKKGGRAPVLRIQGKKQIKMFLDLLENDNDALVIGKKTYVFGSQKQRCALVMKEICNSNDYNLAIKLDLAFGF
jgi:hypothetical protein